MVDARGIIGNYVVERELGRGGMGVVYAAKHRVLGRPAAIKLLLANTSEDRGRVERFFNEARAAMAIDHPGVVKIYDVGIAADDRPYIAMELLDGVALASLVAPAGLPIRQGVEYACQIASALAAAHDAGVIHRDLKPENIIITRDRSRAIVVDFGIAKLAHQATVRTATGALVGTPLYMSPEQCEGLRDLDARSDLYAFGCVIFAMLTGRPPFFEGGTGGLIGMHLHVAPPPLRSRCANASEALERVVSVLLAKSPDARFRTARATLAALQAPEVRGLAAAPGVPATADLAPGNRSVQPWAATPPLGGAPIARDGQTMATGIGAPHTSADAPHRSHASGSMGAPHTDAPHGSHAHGSMSAPHGSHAPPSMGLSASAPGTAFGVPASRDAWTQVTGVDVRDPRTAAVQAVGTPSPSSSNVGATSSSAGSYPSSSNMGSTSSSAGSYPASSMGPSGSMGPSLAITPSGVGHAPSHGVPSHAMTPSQPSHAVHAMGAHGAIPRAPSRRKMVIAIVASSALTAMVAIAATRGCGGSGGVSDGGVASGSTIGSNGVVIGANLEDGSNRRANAIVDAGMVAANDPRTDLRGAQPTSDPTTSGQPENTTRPTTTQPSTTQGTAKQGTAKQGAATQGTAKQGTATQGTATQGKATQSKTQANATQPKAMQQGTTPSKSTSGSVQIDPNGGSLPGARPRNEVPGAGPANQATTDEPTSDPGQEVVRKEIHDYMLFSKGDHQATLGQRTLDRVAANHRLDPTRRIVITGHAEQDEPGVLDSLVGARVNTVFTHLINRGVSRSVLVTNSTRFIDPVTPNGANRRVNIDFE